MDVRNLTVNIYLSNGKLCLKRFFKTSYFPPTRIPYIKEKVHTAVCRGRVVFWKMFCGTEKLSFGATFNSPQSKKYSKYFAYLLCFTNNSWNVVMWGWNTQLSSGFFMKIKMTVKKPWTVRIRLSSGGYK